MSHAQAFLDEIRSHPDNDNLRLVYADWLEERGDPRAEFIRVQVERATLPEWDARQPWLRFRENQLVKQHGNAWRAELPVMEGVAFQEFRRGFVATAMFRNFGVLISNTKICQDFGLEAATVGWPREEDDCEATTPLPGLRELSLSGRVMRENEVERLSVAPLLSGIQTLNVDDCQLTGYGFRGLLSSPHLGNVKALCVPGNAVGNQAIAGLKEATSLKSLEKLDLSETAAYGRSRSTGDRYFEDSVLEASDLKALAAWSGMKKLRSLTLSGNAARGPGLRALLRSKNVAQLKELRLRSNELDDQAMKEFAKANPELQLDVLDLGENLIGDVGAAEMALAPCLAQLKMLRMDRCEIRSSGARWLSTAPFLDSLRCWDLGYNSVDAEAIYRLMGSKPPHLHTLRLTANELGDEGVAHLCESPASNTLVELVLSRNGLDDHAIKYLTRSKHLQNLQFLDLFNNSFSLNAADTLGSSPLGKRLAVLECATFP